MTDFYTVVLGDRPGVACVAFGRKPHRTPTGKYQHAEWQELRVAWPADRDQLLADIEREVALGDPVDVYLCPAVRNAGAKGRRKGDALPPLVCWADLDGAPADPALYARLVDLGALVVRSGSGEHQHLYVPLTRPVPLSVHQPLNQALARRLGGDAKWSDESLLRLPGTLNWKAAFPPDGVEAAAPMSVAIEQWNGQRVDPDTLAELLDVDPTTPAAAGPTGSAPLPSAEPMPDPLPGPVLRALAEPSSGDRSADAARVVEACAFSRLTEGQALTVLTGHPAAAHYKHVDHMAADVARLYRKFAPTTAEGSQKPQNPYTAEAPRPLPTLPPLVEFPADALPDWVRDWVQAEAEATQTPEDLAGTCSLCVLAACAGGRVEVEARSGWREPTNIYGLPVMPPGSRKSAVVSAATRPLYAAEEDLAAAVRAEQAEALVTRDIAQKAAKSAMEKAAKAPADKRAALTSDAISAQSAAEGIDVPVTPRLIADDVTPEAVGSLLAAHGGRLAIISAEGGVFDTMNGRYSNGVPSLDVWLKGHSGDVLRVDRKGREAEYVKRPALTLLLTVQPAVLGAVARNQAFRGRGLVARFLYALPPDNVGRRKVGADPVPADVTATYEKRVRELVAELAAWTDPAVLTLTPEAHELLLQLERNVEPRLKADGEYGPIREWASKLVGAILRIAALLHLAEDGGQRTRMPIEADTLRRAARFGDYFAAHAMRAFGGLAPHDRDHAAELLVWLTKHAEKQSQKLQNTGDGAAEPGSVAFVTVSVRDAHSALHGRAWVESADDIRAAFEVLEEHGWVRLVEREPGKTGRPSQRYELHPDVTTRPAQPEHAEVTRPARPLTEETP